MKKKTKPRLITISTSSDGKLNCDYIFTLRELQLLDLSQHIRKDTHVSITLSVHKVYILFLVFSAFQVAPSFIIEKENRSIYITFCYILLNNIHLFVRLNQMWHIISMLGLGNQWKEGSQPASPLNVAIVAPHT